MEAASFKDQIINLVKTAADVQNIYDLICDQDLDRCAAMFKRHEISPEHPLFRALLPTYLSVSAYQIDVGFLLSCTKDTSFEFGFKLLGYPIHTFFELRYGSTEKFKDRFSIKIERVPSWKPNIKPKEDNDV